MRAPNCVCKPECETNLGRKLIFPVPRVCPGRGGQRICLLSSKVTFVRGEGNPSPPIAPLSRILPCTKIAAEQSPFLYGFFFGSSYRHNCRREARGETTVCSTFCALGALGADLGQIHTSWCTALRSPYCTEEGKPRPTALVGERQGPAGYKGIR